MTVAPRAQRTLVKSPPELWAEISDSEALTRHLGEFGDVRITRLDPETTVAWEGDRVRGTVELEASGWGTKVTLTAETPEPGLPAPAVEEVAPPVAAPAREPAPLPAAGRRSFFSFFRRRPRTTEVEAVEEPEPPVESSIHPAHGGEPTSRRDAPEIEAVLVGVLDDLGSASKRPFSR